MGNFPNSRFIEDFSTGDEFFTGSFTLDEDSLLSFSKNMILSHYTLTLTMLVWVLLADLLPVAFRQLLFLLNSSLRWAFFMARV